MDVDSIPKSLLQAYSKAEISRAEIADQLEREVPFGEIMLALFQHRLPLPRYPANLDSPAAQLLRHVLRRQSAQKSPRPD